MTNVEREPRRARARLDSDASARTYGIGTPASGPFACENSQTPLTLLAEPSNTRWLAAFQNGFASRRVDGHVEVVTLEVDGGGIAVDGELGQIGRRE